MSVCHAGNPCVSEGQRWMNPRATATNDCEYLALQHCLSCEAPRSHLDSGTSRRNLTRDASMTALMSSTTVQDVAEAYEEGVFRWFGASSPLRRDQDPRFMSEVYTRFREP
ncbi:hypothetical protein GQ600_22373 [Phytophthora cactorum]|nr:hypothetical protein GQ600_22373 [Phytophthora cactorum]